MPKKQTVKQGIIDTAVGAAEVTIGGVAAAAITATDVANRVVGAAEGAFDHVAGAAEGVATKVTDATGKAVGAAGRVAAPLTDNVVARPFVNVAGKIYGRAQSIIRPEVEGEGEDFGESVQDPDKPTVVLRMEVMKSTEVKFLLWLSWILALFAFIATAVLTTIKFKIDAELELKNRVNYFLACIILCAIFLVLLFYTGALFLYRVIQARRSGYLWSRRRKVICRSAALVLIAQIVNVSCMLVTSSYALSENCRWQTKAMISVGYVQWTCWNFTFLLLVALAHNGALWTGKTKSFKRKEGVMLHHSASAPAPGQDSKEVLKEADRLRSAEEGVEVQIEPELDESVLPAQVLQAQQRAASLNLRSSLKPRSLSTAKEEIDFAQNDEDTIRAKIHKAQSVALVMDAPWTVHLPKVLVWAILQTFLTLRLAKLEVRGFRVLCKSPEPLYCGPVTTTSIISVIFLAVAIGTYFLTYCYFVWRANKDIRSRSYASMRFARMVFGVQNAQVLPVFLALSVCTIVLSVVQITSCWTFVLTWLGIVPLQAVGTSMAVSLCVYFMPTAAKSEAIIVHAWLQEYAWTSSELPAAIRRRNAHMKSNAELGKEPMFCMETAIKMLYFSNLVYSAKDTEDITVVRVDKDEEVEGDEETGAEKQGSTVMQDIQQMERRVVDKVVDKLTDINPDVKAAKQAMGPKNLVVAKAEGKVIQALETGPGVLFKAGVSSGVNSRTSSTAAGTDRGAGGADEDEVLDELSLQEVDENRVGVGNLEEAFSMYDLHSAELVYDKGTDTQALIAWGALTPTVVVAFKGTSSFENVLTDINFLKVNHLPIRNYQINSTKGLKELVKLPVRVHKGFYDAWTKDGYNEVIIKRVGEIMEELGGPHVVTLYVTGHSLGGALATLATIDLKKAYPGCIPIVYTYGQPRVGNKAFATEYNDLIVEHFAVVNGQDPVARIPKGSYSRVGDRVMTNEEGDIIVRPTYLERHLIEDLAPTVSDHMTGSYRFSLMMGIKMQFTERKIPTGQPGARDLARTMNLNKTLMGINMREAELDDPTLEPFTDEMVYKKVLKTSKRRSSRSFSLSCGGQQRSSAGCGCGGSGSPSKLRHSTSAPAHDEIHDEVATLKESLSMPAVPTSI